MKRSISVVAIVAMIPGCTGVLPPAVEIDSGRPSGSPSYADAINWANQYQDKYSDAILNQSWFNTTAGLALIPFSVFAVAKSITGANSKQVASLAAGALGGFGVAKYLG